MRGVHSPNHASSIDSGENEPAVYNDFNPTPPPIERRMKKQQLNLEEIGDELEFGNSQGDLDEINNDL